MNTLVFDSIDLDRTEEFLTTHYGPLRIGSTTSESRTHISWAEGGQSAWTISTSVSR